MRAAQPLPAPRRAIEHGGQLHLHFHGVFPEDVVAAIIEHHRQDG